MSKDRIATSTRYTLHPATERFICEAHSDLPELRIQAHRRLGEHLEAAAKESPYIETYIEAGHHLFEAGEYDRAFELLGSASQWLQGHGRVREGLRVLEPFLGESVRTQMDRTLLNQLLGTVGLSHHRLGEVQKAIEYYEQALVISREIGYRQGVGEDHGRGDSVGGGRLEEAPQHPAVGLDGPS
jgi:tetratricopeptide (TPR) repeat protein